MKGKVFQLALNEEVNPDSSSAKRSQTTGHLIIEMPKMKQVVMPLKKKLPTKSNTSDKKQTHEGQDTLSSSSDPEKHNRIHHERLEIEPSAKSEMDFSQIVKDSNTVHNKTTKQEEKVDRITQPKDDSFVDDPDVPPLI
ncbi:Protein tilB [Desmophyllum pertusum]|uniref:Protein tilB n=1 Tax=Desmophyllum pertusum TaxID=174260 RepID=A0A9X0CHC3_9CNID|nr:Protein tilB [Desmophyllum pertusum]